MLPSIRCTKVDGNALSCHGAWHVPLLSPGIACASALHSSAEERCQALYHGSAQRPTAQISNRRFNVISDLLEGHDSLLVDSVVGFATAVTRQPDAPRVHDRQG